MAKIIDKKAKKAEILEAALQVLGRKGIAGTKIQDIAEEAGIGKGTIYLYYRNKEEILQSILESHVDTSAQATHQFKESNQSAEQKVKTLLEGFAHSSEGNHYAPGLHLEILAALLRNQGGEALGRGAVRFRDLLADLFREIQGEKQIQSLHLSLASALIGLLHGMMMLWSVNPEEFPLEETIKNTSDFIIRSLQNDKS